jgi:ferredoxin
VNKNLHIDWIACDGRGLCSELLPALLDRDDWGYPLVREPHNGDVSNLSIDAGDEAAAVDAVQLCPMRALRLDASHRR